MRIRISKTFAIWYIGALVLVALIIAVAVGLTNNDSRPANAAVGDVTQVIWGDANCDNVVDVKDLLTTEQAILGIPQTLSECGQGLQVGTRIIAQPSQTNLHVEDIQVGALHYQGYFGDIDCNGHVQVQDALVILKAFANLPVSQVVGCAPVNFAMDVTEIPIGNITPPGPIAQVAIDAETSGNTANSLGTVQNCAAPTNGASFDVDVIAKGVPSFANFAGGLGGFDFVLVYDPSQLVVTAVNDQMMLATGTHNIVSYTAVPPVTIGHLLVRAYDLSNNPESGDGVLARVTVHAIGSGQSILSVIAPPPARNGVPQIVDNENWIYSINNVSDASVRIGSACGTPTPTPSPTPLPTPSPTPGPGSNECPSGSPIDIPDNDPGGVSDTKTLAEAGTISNMAMCLDISTVWAGDLTATLTHVDTGSSITLFSTLGGSHTGTCHDGIDTNIHVYLTDDESKITDSLEEACDDSVPLDGTFPPEQPFATFNGPFINENIAGDWKLTVTDGHEDGFTATIDGWQLYFNQ